MIVVAALLAYLIGSIPSAAALGGLSGVDLRHQGSGNPGANNALRLGGPVLAAAVLFVEMAKGAVAVLVGLALAGEAGAVAGGFAAAAGNVFNPWYRLEGGKGLGITAGALLALWPTVVLPAVILISLAAVITRSSGSAAVVAIVGLNVMAMAWFLFDWPTRWGIDRLELLVVYSAGIATILWHKHWRDASINPGRRRGSPPPG